MLRRSRLRDDIATAVMFVFMLALGVVLISRASTSPWTCRRSCSVTC